MSELTHVSICICTYRRPKLLKRLLTELCRQDTKGLFSYSVVVADNDDQESAKLLVTEFTAINPIEITYCAEPRKGISFVRNKTLEQAKGDAIVFIDDDEFPAKDWLFNLLKTCLDYGVSGVLGPVKPYFNEEPPAWIKKGGFYVRPTHKTGFVMPWQECRTGNVIFRRQIIDGIDPVFRSEFAHAGSDVDFFRRMIKAGHKFIWCDEAIVNEVVSPNRWTRSFMVKRALLRGRNSLRHPEGRFRSVTKSMIAVPIYTLALPFLQLAGHHYFMNYLVKLCDHLGKLLALLKLNPVREREM